MAGVGAGGSAADLHSRVHRGAYSALPSRRVYLEKGDGRKRPLGIAALEDKIVQHEGSPSSTISMRRTSRLLVWISDRDAASICAGCVVLAVPQVQKVIRCISMPTSRLFSITSTKAWMIKFTEHRVAGPPHPAPDPEMAQGWGDGGREWSDTETGTP